MGMGDDGGDGIKRHKEKSTHKGYTRHTRRACWSTLKLMDGDAWLL